jgi:hypothetical protein
MIGMVRPIRGNALARAVQRLQLSSSSSSSVPTSKPPVVPTNQQTQGIGTGKTGFGTYIKDRGPVSWPSLLMVGVAAASCVAYYNIERERRLEAAMGRVVSSESDGWTPNGELLAKRKFNLTPWGWFPVDDGFGPCKSVVTICLGSISRLVVAQENESCIDSIYCRLSHDLVEK